MKKILKNNSLIIPPIKSQGIKTKLVPWIMDIIPKVNGKWVEPFLGTGVVAFNSGFDEALLSDTNPHIINFYLGIQDGSITPRNVKLYLEKEGKKLSFSEEDGYVHFRTIRDRFNKNFEPLDFLFLSRTGFNGMMRFSNKGNWNIPFCKKPDRFRQSYITKIVNQISKVGSVINKHWVFKNQNFKETIGSAKENDLIYCDPPYLGRYVDYYNGWNEKDESVLFNLLNETKAKFVLSTWHHNDFRENLMIKKYWSHFNIVTKDHFYHSGGKIENRKQIVEALVCNYELNHVASHNHSSLKEFPSEQLSIF